MQLEPRHPTPRTNSQVVSQNRELELQELYDLPEDELDLLMAETAEIRSDPENRSRSHGRWCTAGYVLELAKIIDARRARDLSA